MKFFILSAFFTLGILNVSAGEIQRETKIMSLLDPTTFHNFKSYNYTRGFRFKKIVQQPETNSLEFPTLAKGKLCTIQGQSNSSAQSYEVGDSYFLDTIDDYQTFGDQVINEYDIRLVGFHLPTTLVINCQNRQDLTFQDIADDLGVIEFFN
jgi:hypothetical protein